MDSLDSRTTASMLTAHGRFDELLLYVEAGVGIVVHIRVRINVTTEGDVLCCGGSIMQHSSIFDIMF